ncbi:GNAT family N-acetyltransferase [Rhodobacterales bacterium HKCCE2091]|nr:GNAT family N-acetyltransferase [Rhodobacterales bacterium HKCCE2091]
MIRRATAADADAIAAIWNPIIRDSTITFTTEEKTAEGLRARIASEPVFVAEDGTGAVAGFAVYFPFRGGPGYRFTMEHSINLAPAARGQGIGRALLAAVEGHARDAGVVSMFAGVSAENAAGIAFHARAGYAEAARLPRVGHKFGRFLDLVLMRKFL